MRVHYSPPQMSEAPVGMGVEAWAMMSPKISYELVG
jgi:hypothetical protein